MRTLLSCLLCFTCFAAETSPPAVPATAQKLLDDAVASLSKARQTYDTAAKKEQDKLSAALTKEQERETKKGNLDGALAIKALIDEVENGLLTRKVDEAGDLLGDGAKPAAPGTVPANLQTDCPIATGPARIDTAPKSIEPMIAKASVLAIPKGDKVHYNFNVAAPGTVAILTGTSDRNHADLWPELLKAGFKRVDEAGASGAWFVLEAKSGTRFVAFDPPLAGAQVQIFAGKIKLAH